MVLLLHANSFYKYNQPRLYYVAYMASASPFWRARPCGSSLKSCYLAAEQNSISDATAATAIGPHDAKSRHLAGEEEVKRCLNGSGMQLQRLSCMACIRSSLSSPRNISEMELAVS